MHDSSAHILNATYECFFFNRVKNKKFFKTPATPLLLVVKITRSKEREIRSSTG